MKLSTNNEIVYRFIILIYKNNNNISIFVYRFDFDFDLSFIITSHMIPCLI
jgi:hypothetical protein